MGSATGLSIGAVLVLTVASGAVVWAAGRAEPAEQAAVPDRAVVVQAAAQLTEALAFEVAEASRPEPKGLCPDTNPAERDLRAHAHAAPYGTPSIVRGIVLRELHAVSGLEVRMSQWGGDGARGVEPWERLVTDDEGRFEGRFAADALIELRVFDDQFGSARAEVRTTPGSIDEVELVIERPKAIVGWVRDAQDRPVVEAYVSAEQRVASLLGAFTSKPLPPLYAFGMTDADGTFQLPLQGDGTLTVSAGRPMGAASSEVEVAIVDGVPPPPVILRLPD